MKRLWPCLIAAGLLVAGCSSSETPAAEVIALVDRSETWLNTEYQSRNASVLAELGEGIFLASETIPPPFVVQYRVIGAQSYEKPPVCDAVYQPTMISTRKAKPTWLVTKAKKFQRYLGVDCPAALLQGPPEPLTEISAAIVSASAKPKNARTRRTLVILSDFLEETPDPAAATYGLKGVRVLILYRPLRGEGPASTGQRVREWTALLESRGATVTSWPDTALKRADVAGYLVAK